MHKRQKARFGLVAVAATSILASGYPAEASRALATEAYQQRAEDVLALFQGSRNEAEIFSADFLKEVPVAQIREIQQQLIAQYGPAQRIVFVSPTSPYDGIVEYQFEHARVSVSIAIEREEPQRIIGLLIGKVVAK